MGQKLGHWTVLKRGPDRQYKTQRVTVFVCKCDCGNIVGVNSQHLRTGRTTRCSECKKIYALGMKFGTRTLIARGTSDANRNGRWKWKCDCGAVGWINTAKEMAQRRCQRCIPEGEYYAKCRKITAGGKTLPLASWAKRVGLTRQAIYHRLDMGWPEELAVTLPKGSILPEGIHASRRSAVAARAFGASDGSGRDAAEGSGAVDQRPRIAG